MAIWFLLALMTAAAVMAVLWPLSRRPAGDAGPELDADRRLYEDQIAEIERDIGRGLLSPAEAEAARAEAGRRLLRARGPGEREPESALGEPALRRRRAASALALSTIPLLALTIYGVFGSPGLPGSPLAARLAADPKRVPLAEAVVRVEHHLAQNPEDGRGWEVLAPVYLKSGRAEDAVKAYQAVIRILGENASRLADYGEALVTARDGVVPAEARAAFERALALEAGAAKPRFYMALAAEQDGDVEAARGRYSELIASAPGDAAWLPVVRERLARLEGGGPVATVAASPAPDQDAAIRGMVAGLAARLEEKGGTPEEWARLVRSYVVLGERDKAHAALARARQAVAAAGREAIAPLEALGREVVEPVADGRAP